MIDIEAKKRDLRDALNDLRLQAEEVKRELELGHFDEVLGDIEDGEFARKLKLVEECTEALGAAIRQQEEREINRHDGYGHVDG